MPAEARAGLQKATELDDLPWYKGWLRYAYAVSGDRAKADQILNDLEELAKKKVCYIQCARAYLSRTW
jgi:hypothetical protein